MWSAFLVTAERGVYFATSRGSFIGPETALESAVGEHMWKGPRRGKPRPISVACYILAILWGRAPANRAPKPNCGGGCGLCSSSMNDI